MRLHLLEKCLEEVHSQIDELSFSELIRQCRDVLGIKQYRAGEFMGINHQRLNNLETGYFRNVPTQDELNGIGNLFDLEVSMLESKAQKHMKERELKKKITTLHDG